MKLFWFEDRDRFEHNVLVVRAETLTEAKAIAEKAVRESWSWDPPDSPEFMELSAEGNAGVAARYRYEFGP